VNKVCPFSALTLLVASNLQSGLSSASWIASSLHTEVAKRRVLRKVIKIVTTRHQMSCTKYDFGWGSAADPADGAYSAPVDKKGAYF